MYDLATKTKNTNKNNTKTNKNILYMFLYAAILLNPLYKQTAG